MSANQGKSRRSAEELPDIELKTRFREIGLLGGSYIYTGDALQSLTLSGVKGLGIAGTALTVGATLTDLGVNLNASFGCSDQL